MASSAIVLYLLPVFSFFVGAGIITFLESNH